jgi:hypothetical protein
MKTERIEQGFFQKYWLYIMIALILFTVMGGAQEEAK